MQINDLERELRDLVRHLAPSLLEIPGCGVLSAAVIVGETAGVHRFRDKVAFARFAGTAPFRSGLDPARASRLPFEYQHAGTSTGRTFGDQWLLGCSATGVRARLCGSVLSEAVEEQALGRSGRGLWSGPERSSSCGDPVSGTDFLSARSTTCTLMTNVTAHAEQSWHAEPPRSLDHGIFRRHRA